MDDKLQVMMNLESITSQTFIYVQKMAQDLNGLTGGGVGGKEELIELVQ